METIDIEEPRKKLPTGTNRRCITKKNLMPAVLFVVATTLFCYHASTILGRYLKHEILEVRSVVLNESLPMPIIEVRLNSNRHPNSSRPFAAINFSAWNAGDEFPQWAALILHYRSRFLSQDTIRLNVVSAQNYNDCDLFRVFLP